MLTFVLDEGHSSVHVTTCLLKSSAGNPFNCNSLRACLISGYLGQGLFIRTATKTLGPPAKKTI